MSAYELAEKEVLEQIDPWGPRRSDYQAAVIAWIIACSNSVKTKPKFKDFLKMFDFDKRQQTDEEENQFFEMFGG